MSRLARVRAVSYGAALVASGCVAVAGWGTPGWWAALVLGAAITASELAVVHVAFARQRWTFTVTEGVVAGALLLHGGGWVVAGVLAGVAASQAVRRLAWVKLQYNTAQITASAAVAVAVAHALGGSPVAVVAGMLAYWTLNQTLSAVPLAVMSGSPLRRLAVEDAPLHGVHAAASVSLGMLAAWLGAHQPFGLLGLLAPLALLWLSYDEQTARAAEARLFAELADGHERAAGRSTDVSARAVVTAAARLFGGADIEMLLLGVDGPMRYTGDEHEAAGQRAAAGTLDEPWVLRALGSSRVLTGVEETGEYAGRPYCSAVLGAADRPLAVLVARRPPASGLFGRREATLAGVLVQQAQSWLSVAELTRSRDDVQARFEAAEESARALGDVGARAAPSLLVLRESAARLARLATDPTGPDPVTEIVAELHAAERAVASLLGAVALAAEPDLGRLADGTGPLPPSQEWTTTGVLVEAEPR